MTFEWWMVSAAANAVMVTIFGLMAYKMVHALHEGKQWTTNPILAATAAVFITCTLGHGVHLIHTLEPYAVTAGLVGQTPPARIGGGIDLDVAQATRVAMSDPIIIAWDSFTAIVAVVFWIVRSRLEYLVHGHALNVDMEKRQHEALELHDNVVQSLVQAKMAFDQGDREEGRAAIEEALARSKRITARLLGDHETGHVPLGASDLRIDPKED